MPMINEAIFAVMEGVGTPEAIDTVMKLGMNHPMGPLTLADFIGLDVCLAILDVLHDGLGDPKYRAVSRCCGAWSPPASSAARPARGSMPTDAVDFEFGMRNSALSPSSDFGERKECGVQEWLSAHSGFRIPLSVLGSSRRRQAPTTSAIGPRIAISRSAATRFHV